MSLSLTARSARSCHAASSGGRTPRLDPDFDKPPDVPRDTERRQEPLDGVGWELLELLPQAAVQDRFEDRPQELWPAIHIYCPRAAIPRPDLHATRHATKLAR